MSAKKAAPRKSASIPGYAGYRPGIKSNGHMGKTATEQSREIFNKTIDFHKTAFSSTGFNAKLIPKEDDTRESISIRYGTETRHKPHPLHHPANYYTTTARSSFTNPMFSPKPTATTRDPAPMFEAKPALNWTALKGASGFGADTHFVK